MRDTRMFRLNGLALVVGACVFVLHVVFRSAITAGQDPVTFSTRDLWLPVNALGVLGSALIVLGLPAVYSLVADRKGRPGLIGLGLLTVAWLFLGVFVSLYAVLVQPWLAAEAPSLVAATAPLPVAFVVAFLVGLVAWLAGAVLLAIPFIRGRVRPRWVGYVLITSGLWAIIGDLVVAPSGPAASLPINLLSNLGPVLLVVALGYLGLRAWQGERRAPSSQGPLPPRATERPCGADLLASSDETNACAVEGAHGVLHQGAVEKEGRCSSRRDRQGIAGSSGSGGCSSG